GIFLTPILENPVAPAHAYPDRHRFALDADRPGRAPLRPYRRYRDDDGHQAQADNLENPSRPLHQVILPRLSFPPNHWNIPEMLAGLCHVRLEHAPRPARPSRAGPIAD